jgi:fused signal recognition particle receptor
MLNIIHSLREGLEKTRKNISDKIGNLVLGEKIDESFLEELEEALIASDVGTQTASLVLTDLKERFKRNELSSPEQVRERLKSVLFEILASRPSSLSLVGAPAVILVIGVNGTGKTTTIGKLARRLQGEGKKVMLAAADTFRAAAAEQLTIWGDRNNIPVIKHKEGADPGAVVFDALVAAKARGMDVLIVDTAGRLHTKSNLMEELKKVRRILERELPGAPHETLFVLDATTGQNALAQAKMFHQAIGVTGIALTKLDGTPKGGIVFAINKELGIPVKFIGVGEGIEDLKPFDPREFVEALLETSDQ